MVDITTWMNDFLQNLNHTFENRVWFVGLQGSYGRGEATETSDIDIVVILDQLSVTDIQKYNAMLDTLPNRELICGFLSGKADIMNSTTDSSALRYPKPTAASWWIPWRATSSTSRITTNSCFIRMLTTIPPTPPSG